MLKDAEALNRGQSKNRQHYGTFLYLSTDQTRYISKTDTALQFYTTKLTDYSVERRRLVMAMVYVFLWTTLECSVKLRFKLYSLLSWVLNTNGILCCYIKYSQSIQIFTPTKLIEYFCTVALSLESLFSSVLTPFATASYYDRKCILQGPRARLMNPAII